MHIQNNKQYYNNDSLLNDPNEIKKIKEKKKRAPDMQLGSLIFLIKKQIN